MAEQTVNMNNIVSSSIFYSQNEEVTFDNIRQNSVLLFNYVHDRQIKNYMSCIPNNEEINSVTLNLGLSVKGNPSDRKFGGQAKVIKDKM